jgi:hypothetical protein
MTKKPQDWNAFFQWIGDLNLGAEEFFHGSG